MIRTAVVVSLLAPLACADSGAPPPSVATATDSAGIRVVTTAPGDLVYAELAAEPALSIGQLSGPDELLFGRIQSARRDAAGNLVVADGQAYEIRIFDGEGRHLRSLGREGEGPGEFESLQGAWPVTDGGIVAADPTLERITQFDGEGIPTGTATLAERDNLRGIFAIGLAGPGMVLSRASPRNVPDFENMGGSMADMMDAWFGGEQNRRLLFVRHRLDGALVDTLAEGKDAPVASVAVGDAAAMTFTIPFSPRSIAAGSPYGIVVTHGAIYEIRFFDQSGSMRMIARLDDAPEVRTDEHLERYAGYGSSEPDEAEIRERIERYRQVPLPDRLPAYEDILFAEEGEVWARRYRLTGETEFLWDVFAADGIYLGRVNVPASFRIEEVGRSQILGVATDELGVERVQIRQLTLNGL